MVLNARTNLPWPGWHDEVRGSSEEKVCLQPGCRQALDENDGRVWIILHAELDQLPETGNERNAAAFLRFRDDRSCQRKPLLQQFACFIVLGLGGGDGRFGRDQL